MVTAEVFYKCYQLHHHRAKATMLNKLLQNEDFIKAEEILFPIYAFTKEDYQRMLKIEMRANLFHAIETLFTLFFCLQPNKNGNVDDLGLLKNINRKKFYYEQIRAIASDKKTGLKSLDNLVNFQAEKVTFGQYLFYFALKKEKFPPGLQDSIEAIKYALFLLAAELSDTAEYNSYKHCLRSIPAFSQVYFAKHDTLEIVKSFDLKDSMTYLQEFKDNSFSYRTKIFDVTRDYRMTELASNLIYNIIMFRRASVVNDLSKIVLHYYDKKSVDACVERNKDLIEFSNKFSLIIPNE